MENWILPCNVKLYDVPTHFKSSNSIIWRNLFTMRKGDNAYIYLGKPFKEIRYKCKVISDVVDEDTISKNAYAKPAKASNNYYSKRIKYVELELEKEYPAHTFQLFDLQEHGLGQVQIQARMDRRLLDFIISEEKLIFKQCKSGDDND